MTEIDYEQHSLKELLDVKEHIDRQKYPERYAEVLRQIALRESASSTEDFPPSCRVCPSFLIEKRVKPHFGAGKTMLAYLAGDIVFYVLFFLTIGCWVVFPIGIATVVSILVSFYVIYIFQKVRVILVCPTCREEYTTSDFET